MKQSLQLNVNQHLSLTPKLQQAIRLLQLSTHDLQQEIQQKLDQNPMLNTEDENELSHEDAEFLDKIEASWSDIQWSPLYANHMKNNHLDQASCSLENICGSTINLQDYLRWQLELTPMSNLDRAIGTAIIDVINDDGLMTTPPTELYHDLNCKAYPVDFSEIEAVRHLIQHFDPLGCGACDLKETLLIQLEELPPETPHLKLTKTIVQKDLCWIAKHDYPRLIRQYHLDEATLEQVLNLIQHLHPKPGTLIPQAQSTIISPDLVAKKIGQRWLVRLNPCLLPQLSINKSYASLVSRAANGLENQFLKTHLQEAKWFLKSLQSRQETLLKVAEFIVDYQKQFLEFGEEAMRPLILNDVALALDMHESTISRITTQKYIHTPRGLFELKYFFSTHVPTKTGEACSSIAIRALIKKWIATENHAKPLTDQHIAKRMNEQGISIARRTVSNYREMMHIPPSCERKSIDLKTTKEVAKHNTSV